MAALPQIDSWSDLLGTALQVGGDVYKGITQMKAQKKAAKAASGVGQYYGLPTGYSTGAASLGWSAAPTQLGQTIENMLGLGPPVDLMAGVTAGGSSTAPMPGCPTLFAPASTQMRFRAMSLVSAVSPNGKLHFWRHVGQPILYSGDVAHCRRVNKLLGKQSRRAHSRRPR